MGDFHQHFAASVAAKVERWDEDGFVVLPSFLSADEFAPAVAELPGLFPTGDEFHDDLEPERNARFRSEFGGIVDFHWRGSSSTSCACIRS